MSTEILVTGGGGLLGYAVKKICPEAVFLTRRDGDLTDLGEVHRLFETHRPKRVLHLAARVAGVKSNAKNNADLFASNVQINTHVLNAARQHKVTRLVSVLSSCAFQFYEDRPSTEDDLHVGLPFEGNLGYGYAKRMLDVQTRVLYQQDGCPFSTLTPVTMYGPNDNWDLEEGHVIGSLIHKCFLAKEEAKALEVWGSGKAVRQFVFSSDVARILLQALESFHGPQTVVMTPDSGITIAELAKLIAETMSFKGPLLFNADRPEGQRVRVIQSRKFSSQFPGFRFTPLEEGLKETVEWYIMRPFIFKEKRRHIDTEMTSTYDH